MAASASSSTVPGPVDYLLIGHIASDIVPGGRAPGGTVTYAAHTAAAFGLRVGVVTSATPGDPVLAAFAGVAQVVNLPAEQTTTYENIYTPDGRIQYVRGVAAPLHVSSIPEAWRDAPLVHLAPIADEVDAGLVDVFARSVIMLTPQGWMRRWGGDGRVRFMPWQDYHALAASFVTVISEEDIADAPELAHAYAARAPRLVVTRSYHGGLYYIDRVAYSYAAVPSAATYPTGAGDVFATSLFAAWDRLRDFHAAVAVAAELAAHSVTRDGLASAPTADEIRAALAV
ncbi:MAG: PfkB family carbohydrate kinase [Chloroflexota bacterium]